MKFTRTLELMDKYAKCQECGSEMIGDGSGALIIEDDVFIRTCTCGWEIRIKDDESNE